MFYIVRDNGLGDLYANALGILNRDLDCNYGGNVNYVSSYLFVRAASLPISLAAFVAQYLYDDRESVLNYDKYFLDFGLQVVSVAEWLYRDRQNCVLPFVSHLMWTFNCANIDFDSLSIVDMVSFLSVSEYDGVARDVAFLYAHFNDSYGRMNAVDVFHLHGTSAHNLATSGLLGDFRVSALVANSLFDVGYGDRWLFQFAKSGLVMYLLRFMSLVAISKARLLPLLSVDSLQYGISAYVMPAMHVVAQRAGFPYPKHATSALDSSITSETIASIACDAFKVDNRFVASKMHKFMFSPRATIAERRYSLYDLFAMMQAYVEAYNETVLVGYNEFCQHFSRASNESSFGFGSIFAYLLTGVKPNLFFGFNYALPVVNVDIKKLLQNSLHHKEAGYKGVMEELKEYSKGLEYVLFKLLSNIGNEHEQYVVNLLIKYKLADMRKVYSSVYYDEMLYIVEYLWDKMSQVIENEDKLVGKFMPEERKSLYKLSSVTGVDLSIVEYADLRMFDRQWIKGYYNMQYSVSPVILEFNIMPQRFIGIMLSAFSFGHILEKVSLILRKSTIDQIPKNVVAKIIGKQISVVDGMPTDGILMHVRRHFVDMYLAKLNSFIDINWLINPFEEGFEYGNFVARHCYVESMYLDKAKKFGYSVLPSYDTTFSLVTFLLNRTGVVSCGTLSIGDGVKNILLYDMVNRMLPSGSKMPTSLFKEVVKDMPDVSIRIGGSNVYIEVNPRDIILGNLAQCTEYYKTMAFSSILTTEAVILMNEMQDGYLKHTWLECLLNSIVTAFMSPYIASEWFNIGINERFPVAVLSSYFVPYGDYRATFASYIPATVQHNMDPGYLSLFNSHVTYGGCGDADNDLVDSYNDYVVKIPFTNSLFSSCLDSIRARGRNYWLNIGRSHLMTACISDRTATAGADHGDKSLIHRLYFSPVTDVFMTMDNDYELVTWLYFRYSQGLPRYLNFDVVLDGENKHPLFKFNVRDMLFHVFSSQIIGCSYAPMICNNSYTGNSYAASFIVRPDDDASAITAHNSLRAYQFTPHAPFERLVRPMFIHPYFHYTTYHYNVAGLASSVYWINSIVCAFASATAYVRAHKYKHVKEVGLHNSLKRKPSNGFVIMQKFYNYRIINGKFFVCEEGSVEVGVKIGGHIVSVDFGGVRRFLRASVLSGLFNYDIHGFNTGVNLPTSVPTTTILVLFNAIIESIVGYNTVIGNIIGNTNQRQHRSIVSLKRYKILGDDIIEYGASLGPLINEFNVLNFAIFATCAVGQSMARYRRNFSVRAGETAYMLNSNTLCVFLNASEFLNYSIAMPVKNTVNALFRFGFNVVNAAYELIAFAYTRVSMTHEEAMKLYEGTYTQAQIDKLKEDIEALKVIREETMKALEENVKQKNALQAELEASTNEPTE